MFTYLKTGLALTALCLSFSQLAQAQLCREGDSLYPCGLTFTNIPTVPNPIETGTTNVGPYTLSNQGDSSVTISTISLNIQGDDTAGGTVGSGGSCYDGLTLNPFDSCDIYLSLQPSAPGLLDWDLTVTPQSTQRPLVLGVSTTVIENPDPTGAYVVGVNSNLSTITYCSVSGISFSACSPVTLTIASGGALQTSSNIVLNSSATMAYISETGPSSTGAFIVVCPIIDATTFGNVSTPCQREVGSTYLSGPRGLAMNGSETQLYITTVTGGTIVSCDIDGSGDLSSCTTQYSASQPIDDIAFNSDYSLAYATIPGSNAVDIFTVDGSGVLSYSSQFTDSSFNTPWGIQVYSGEVYVTNAGNTDATGMSWCTISGNTLTSCISNIPTADITNPAGFEIVTLAGASYTFIASQGALFDTLHFERISAGYISRCPTPTLQKENYSGCAILTPVGIPLRPIDIFFFKAP